jgi:membrane dipeptidase
MKLMLLSLLLAVAAAAPDARGDELNDVASLIHRQVLVIDTHIDIPLDYAAAPASDPGAAESGLKASLDKMEAGGYGCAFLISYTPQGSRSPEATAAARRRFAENRLDGIDRMLNKYPLRAVKALSPDDVLSARAAGRLAVAIGMENGYPVGSDLSALQYFYGRGVRYITLTHNGDNDLADSANPPNRDYPQAAGDDKSVRLLHDVYIAEDAAAGPPPGTHGVLSEFGRKAVLEMNRLGIIVDVSHTSPATVEDVLAATQAPVIASHSSCRALCDNRRDLTDDQLRAIAANGGVVQITAVPEFVKAPPAKLAAEREQLQALGALEIGYDGLLALWRTNRAAYDEYSLPYLERIAGLDKQYPSATLTDFVDHIDHVVQVAGIAHVGIGSDFDGGGAVPGFNSAADAPAVTLELVRRGYTEEQIAQIWGGNLLRVWREVEAVAKKIAGK